MDVEQTKKVKYADRAYQKRLIEKREGEMEELDLILWGQIHNDYIYFGNVVIVDQLCDHFMCIKRGGIHFTK